MSVRFLGISAFCVMSVYTFSPDVAYAGFEWVAPQQNKQISRDDYAESTAYKPASNNAAFDASNSMAVPPIPVSSEPLGVSAPMPVASTQIMQPSKSAMPMNGKRPQGLIIDPYPMTDSKLNPQYKRSVSGASIHKGMNEEARVAHPMQLGRNMSTMTQPVRISSVNKKMDLPYKPESVVTPLPSGITAPKMPDVQYSDAVGFGRELPLALALSQVVPDEYAFSFAEDNAAGEIVSWQGGKPWDQVLDDMLADQGLRAIIQGKKVTIAAL